MRILLCNDHLGIGGVERASVALAGALHAQGHAPSMLLLLKKHRALQAQLAGQVPVQDLGLDGFKNPLAVIRAVWRAAKLLRAGQYDAMIVTKSYTAAIMLAARLLARTTTPILIVLHEDAVNVVAAHTGIRRLIFEALYRYGYRYADTMIAVSESAALAFSHFQPAGAAPAVVIANPVDLPAAPCPSAPHPWLESTALPVFVTVGRLTPEKNLSLFLEAFAKASAVQPARAIIVGDGPQRSALESLANHLGIKEAVAFVGLQDNPSDYLCRATAMVLSSDHEALPTVIIEALAVHCPVIATACNDTIAQMLGAGSHAQIVPVGDSDALAQAMLARRKQPVDTNDFPDVRARYCPSHAAEKYMAEILSLTARKLARVSCVINSLATGGAELVAVRLMNGFAAQNIAADMVVTGHDLTHADALQQVRLVALRSQKPLIGSVLTVWRLVRYLYRVRPDALISGIENLHDVVWVARLLYWRRMAYVGMIHTTLSEHWASPRQGVAHLKQALTKWTMRRMPLVAVSQAVARDAEQYLGRSAGSVPCIYNPVVTRALAELTSARRSAVPLVICVGGLKPMKRFDLAIDAFARVRAHMPCQMRIIGEGAERAYLEQCATDSGVAADITFVGYDPDPYAHMLAAGVLLLSSDYEGLPTVLIEALACGCAVVATDCPSGPREILQDGRYGVLVRPDHADEMAQALERVLRADISDQQRHEWMAYARSYSVAQAVQSYTHVLQRQR